MNKTLYLRAVTAAIGLLLLEPAVAGYMRCGTHIIEDGMKNRHTKYEILKKCGEPTERYGNTWIYDKPGRMRRVVVFNGDGSLFNIREQ